ncbi:MAG: siphovirus Gp157 family protein [Paracoccaceae bacterium]|nr:siphovirus Gp157 family protein [Paracoccaceae bacterium]
MPRLNVQMIAAVAEVLAPYREDGDAFWDSLDGETDILDIIDTLLDGVTMDDAMADAIKARMDDMSVRKFRLEARSAARRAAIGKLLEAAGMKSVERPAATVSVRSGRMQVVITDDAEIPTQLRAPPNPGAPDKGAIGKALGAGEYVPGAQHVRGPDIVTVRTK